MENTFDLTIKHNLHVGMQNAINQIAHLENLIGIADGKAAFSDTSRYVIKELERLQESLSLIEPEGEQPNEAIEFAKFIAGYEEPGNDDYGPSVLTLIDGVFYWDTDDHGDCPLSEEMLYEWFKKSKAVTLSEASNHSFQQGVEVDPNKEI